MCLQIECLCCSIIYLVHRTVLKTCIIMQVSFMKNDMFEFTLDNYPKSHGSLDGWRLHEYLHLTEAEQAHAYKQLEAFCLQRVDTCPALDQHNAYTFIGSGWEWSVFAKDASTVIKTPAGIFPEVASAEYLVNAQRAYELLKRYYPAGMLARTAFHRHGGVNIIEQERLAGGDNQVIEFNEANKWLLKKLQLFLESTLDLLANESWIPDFWLNEDQRGFVLRNVMISQKNDQFKIVDFTSYLDPARMYPALNEWHCRLQSERVKTMLQQIKAILSARE